MRDISIEIYSFLASRLISNHESLEKYLHIRNQGVFLMFTFCTLQVKLSVELF